jgi:hypothetical protein
LRDSHQTIVPAEYSTQSLTRTDWLDFLEDGKRILMQACQSDGEKVAVIVKSFHGELNICDFAARWLRADPSHKSMIGRIHSTTQL